MHLFILIQRMKKYQVKYHQFPWITETYNSILGFVQVINSDVFWQTEEEILKQFVLHLILFVCLSLHFSVQKQCKSMKTDITTFSSEFPSYTGSLPATNESGFLQNY